MAATRPKFDQEFRARAVRIVRETDEPVVQVARDLGIDEGALRNWVETGRRARERADGNGGLSEGERAELVRLRRENAELEFEPPARAIKD
jgi:transposase